MKWALYEKKIKILIVYFIIFIYIISRKSYSVSSLYQSIKTSAEVSLSACNIVPRIKPVFYISFLK